ncbi:hypothetical protein PANA5342_pPANA10077 (plasmid) [Pantoea ananatis LMG 5342]|nr:hypothetical protein PANA5342_pPANA10077 [Pantoea ananatis LMG 5342]
MTSGAREIAKRSHSSESKIKLSDEQHSKFAQHFLNHLAT